MPKQPSFDKRSAGTPGKRLLAIGMESHLKSFFTSFEEPGLWVGRYSHAHGMA
jgi:hypothetical protein